MSKVDELTERAEKAREKKAAYGPDIPLESYTSKAPAHEKVQTLKMLPTNYQNQSLGVGVDASEDERSGSFFQLDTSVVYSKTSAPNVEVLSVTEALDKYDWLKDYWWKAVAVDADKYTAQAALEFSNGYFIRAKAGAKTILPIQACMFLAQESLSQNVHNIIIAEKGSELHIITGCRTANELSHGIHVGVSEFFIKEGATCSFTMIHNWGPEVAVRPRSGSIIERDATFISNYVCLKPVKSLQMYPVFRCVGANATALSYSLLYATEGSHMDVGARVIMEAEQCKSDVISRAITNGGEIISRGNLTGLHPDVKGHLECRGLLLGDHGRIFAVPELDGAVPGVDMSHEAAVGKIAEEEITYLMTRGLSEEEATSAIVRGFFDIEIKGVPPALQEEMRRAVHTTEGIGL
ncbi:MAG: SufD family Fe-S cluster assembly protein [Halobacteriota archaeon]